MKKLRICLFLRMGQRLLLHREGEHFTDKKNTVRFTKEELRDKAIDDTRSVE